ncbi:MAG: hypothetical protein ISS33_02925 [Candidatus Omnitrophica bacterium]|nr:hypothetical protein [Candidatus Omnitrophota bacterium]
MEKLKLPIIKGRVPPTKSLSMDDYLRFVNLHLKYTSDKKTKKKRQKNISVNVPFTMK